MDIYIYMYGYHVWYIKINDICTCKRTRIQLLCSFVVPEPLNSALVLVLLVVLVLVFCSCSCSSCCYLQSTGRRPAHNLYVVTKGEFNANCKRLTSQLAQGVVLSWRMRLVAGCIETRPACSISDRPCFPGLSSIRYASHENTFHPDLQSLSASTFLLHVMGLKSASLIAWLQTIYLRPSPPSSIMRGLINTLVCLIMAAYVIWLKLKILTFHGTLGTKVHQRVITSFNWHASSVHGQLGTIHPKSSRTGHTE